jgi:general transcription factor 3C polypeptide 3 (transcription factor C subunit 4)
MDWDVLEHVDMFREAADTLREAGHHAEALRLYELLMHAFDRLDSRFYFDIAICYQALGRPNDVRSAIQKIRQGDKDADVHVGLAKLYQSQGKLDLMWRLVRELKKMNKHDLVKKAGLPITKPPSLASRAYPSLPVQSISGRIRQNSRQKKPTKRLTQQVKEEEVQNVVVRAMFDDMQSLQEALDLGDTDATAEWMSLANQLFEEFRCQRAFFPRDKSKAFKGVGGHFARLPEHDEILDAEKVDFLLPKEYRNITFEDWVDLLMRYAILAADHGDYEQCWAVIKVATDANVMFLDPDRLKLVRTTALSKC